MPKPWYRWNNEALILDIRVQPRASRDEIAGPRGERLKIRLTAPPVDGKANQHLLKYLANLCGVRRNQVRLISGANSRNKRIAIEFPKALPAGIDPPDSKQAFLTTCPRALSCYAIHLEGHEGHKGIKVKAVPRMTPKRA